MHWCEAIRCIEASSAAIRRHHETLDTELETLLGFLEHEDVLVMYAAKEELWKVLSDDNRTETRWTNDVVRSLVLTPTTAWRREASGLRLQLLRQLNHVKIGEIPTEGSTVDEEGQLGYIYLQEMLKNLSQVGDMVHSFLVTADGGGDLVTADGGGDLATNAPYSVQYEALVFMSDLVKQLHNLRIAERYGVELSKHMVMLVGDVFVAMDYASQPTFVSCAVLGLLGEFQKLLQFWVSQIQDDGISSLRPLLSKWIERCLVWLLRSFCTPTALRFLQDYEDATVTSQMAFIAESGRYPFLQQWLLCRSRIGAGYASLTHNKNAGEETLQMPSLIGGLHCYRKQLLSRHQLFTVLAEQDDVMIEVLNGLMQITTHADSYCGSSDFLTQWYPALTTYISAEFDPDLLFADLVETLGRDHLVLLDLLVSNETQMLEYLVRYLRHLNIHWNTSKRNLQACGRLESMMSVLIRLRLEIDRLVAAELFPYNAGPLARRMLAIEQLYEEL